MITLDAKTNPAQILAHSKPGAVLRLDQSWWGFGGIHGGLALGILTAALCERSQGRVLQHVSCQYRRALREPFTIDVSESLAGKSVSWLSADALEGDRVAISAKAVFSAPGQPRRSPHAPAVPEVPPPSQCPVFRVPLEIAPFSRHTEIRPVGLVRPFGGHATPELLAWLRLVDDDLPPTAARLMVLMDALAPSYAAVLHKPMAIPSVTFTVTPGSGLKDVASPWVLLRARTDACGADGWLLERMDAWSEDGAHLGSAEQLRFVMDGA